MINMRQLRSSHSGYDQLYPAVTIKDLISWCDSYDQFAEIFYSNLKNPTLLQRFLMTK